MPIFPLTIPDVLASTDVLRDVQNLSDSMTPEQCVEYRIACEKVLQAAKLAIDLLNMQFVKIAETDVVRDGRRFYVGPKTEKEVVDHDRVAQHVKGIALDAGQEMVDEVNSEGVLLGATAAIRVMTDLYLSPGTRVKKGQLDRYGIPRNVIDVQRGEKIVKEVPAGGAIE